MKSSKKILAVATVAIAAFCTQAIGQTILVNDNFDRADGSLVGTAPTPGPGGVWANHSGTLGDLLITSGQAVVQHGVPSEDANTLFADQSSGVLTANFDINVSSGSVIGSADVEYFASFRLDGTFNLRARLYVAAPSGSGDYTLGISTTSGGMETAFTNDFNFGSVVNVDLSFDFTTGLASATVGGNTINSIAPVLGETLNSFALRQSDSTNNETILVDNLVVSVPEPSTYALALGVLGLAIVLIRRRR